MCGEDDVTVRANYYSANQSKDLICFGGFVLL